MTIFFFDQRNDYPAGCTLQEWLDDHKPGDQLTEDDLRRYADRDGDDWWFAQCERIYNQYLSGDTPPYTDGHDRTGIRYYTASYEQLEELCAELSYTDEDAYQDAVYYHEQDECDPEVCDFCAEEQDADNEACECTYDALCELCAAGMAAVV